MHQINLLIHGLLLLYQLDCRFLDPAAKVPVGSCHNLSLLILTVIVLLTLA